jgi:hypothetical protein
MRVAVSLAQARADEAVTEKPRRRRRDQEPEETSPFEPTPEPPVAAGHSIGAMPIVPPEPAGRASLTVAEAPAPEAAPALAPTPASSAEPIAPPTAAPETSSPEAVEAPEAHEETSVASTALDLAEAEPPMPLPERATQEATLGESLAGVSVRSGPAAREALDLMGAEAASRGSTIFLSEVPASPEEESFEPLTHEVAHAVQASKVEAEPIVEADREARAEEEAEAAAPDLAEAVRQAHQPTPEGCAAPEVELMASLGPETVALRREATERPPTPTRGMAEGDPGEAFRRAGGGGGGRGTGRGAGGAEAGRGGAGGGGRAGAAGGAGPSEAAAAPAAPGAPAPATTAAGGGGGGGGAGGGDLPAPEPPALVGEGVEGLFDAFVSAPPSQKAWSFAGLGAGLDAEAQSEAGALGEAVPDLEIRLVGDEAEEVDGEALQPDTDESSLEPEPEGEEPVAEEVVEEAPENEEFAGNDSLFGWVRGLFGGGSSSSNAEDIGEALDAIDTVDDSVETSPGEPPRVPLEGATDPTNMDRNFDEGRTEAEAGRAEAERAVIEGPGREVVQPLEVEEAVAVEGLEQPPMEGTDEPEGMRIFRETPLPAEVQTAFDDRQGAEMQANLADAQAEVSSAAETRDADWDAEIETAQTQNQEAIDQAQVDQEAAVDEQRDNIETEREDTLRSQRDAVESMEEEAEGLREEQQQEIDDEVETREEEIEQEYDDAEVEAEAEVEEGEREAEEEKEEAEREADNQSWWDKVTSWIADAISAVVDAITSIIDAVASVVNGILEAVRDLVVGLINLVSEFIQAAIAAFGELLKGLVNGLLGELFPELAAALTAAIDSAVDLAQQAVAAVADGLVTAVNAVVDAVQAGLNAVLDTFKAAVQVAGAIATAVVTGDWDAALMMMLEAALELAGISPESFYALIGKIEDTIQIILDDPGAFLGNLLDAVVLGFQQFGDNFLTHLQQGFIEWLTGATGGTIQIPETLDLAGIFDIVRQILGLTYEMLREKAVRLIGEQAVSVIEFVASYVQTLLEGGWSALWERIQEDLAGLRDMVIGQIEEWLLTRVVLGAVSYLASMFNPVGALVRVIMTVWNIYTFLRDNLQRLMGLVTAVVDSIHNIATGVIGPAANTVEGVLASLIPLALDLLARLLSLGNVGDKVREVIEGIRQRVSDAIDRLIDRIKNLFSGGGQAGAGTGEGTGETETPANAVGRVFSFSVEGETHRLWLKYEGGDATVVMASSPERPIEQETSELRHEADDLDPEDKQTALTALSTVDQKQQQAETDVERQSQGGGGSGGEEGRTSSSGVQTTAADDELSTASTAAEQAVTIVKTSPSLKRFEDFRSNSNQSPRNLRSGDGEPRFATEHETTEPNKMYDTSSPEPWRAEQYAEFQRGKGRNLNRLTLSSNRQKGDIYKAIQASRASYVSERTFAIVDPGPPAVQQTIYDLQGREPNPPLPDDVRQDLLRKVRGIGINVNPNPPFGSGVSRIDVTLVDTSPIESTLSAGSKRYPEFQATFDWWQSNYNQPEWHHHWPQWMLGNEEQTPKLYLPRILHNTAGDSAVGQVAFHQKLRELWNDSRYKKELGISHNNPDHFRREYTKSTDKRAFLLGIKAILLDVYSHVLGSSIAAQFNGLLVNQFNEIMSRGRRA